jgi:cytochrome c-type biogenesis protein CcmH
VASGLLPGAAAAARAGGSSVSRKEIERAIMCPCEEKCGKVLVNCMCDYSGGFRKDIDRMIARGLTREQILAELVKAYGPTVLAAPGTSNWLDIASWTLPFLALALGAWGITRLLRRWAQPKPPPPAPPAAGPPAAAAGYEHRLDDELSRFEP